MIVKEQKEIIFINDCNAIVDYEELKNAIIWYSQKPVTRTKHIFLHGDYPAISIHGKKIHIHRLLMQYWLKSDIPSTYHVHHLDENKLNASKENLSLIYGRVHTREHNRGKIISNEQKRKIIEYNHSRKGKRRNYTKNISAKEVYDMKKQGMSFNQISKVLGLDWGCVKQRYEDYIHSNPELLEVNE